MAVGRRIGEAIGGGDAIAERLGGGLVGGINQPRRIGGGFDDGAVGALGELGNAQGVAFDIAVVGQHLDLDRHPGSRLGGVGGGRRRVVFGGQGDADGARVRRAGGVLDAVGEAVGAVVVGVGRIGEAAGGIDRHRAMGRGAAGGQPEAMGGGVAGIGVGRGQLAADRLVFGTVWLVQIDRHRRVVGPGHRYRGGRRGGAAMAVRDRVVEGFRFRRAVGQIVVLAVGIEQHGLAGADRQHRAGGQRHRAADGNVRAVDLADRKGIAIDVSIIVDQFDRDRGIIGGGGGEIGFGGGRVVDGGQGQADGGAIETGVGGVVGHRVLETFAAVVIGVGRVDHMAVGPRGGDGDVAVSVGAVGFDLDGGDDGVAGDGGRQHHLAGAGADLGHHQFAQMAVRVDGVGDGLGDAGGAGFRAQHLVGQGGAGGFAGALDGDGIFVVGLDRARDGERILLRQNLDAAVIGGADRGDRGAAQGRAVGAHVVAQQVDFDRRVLGGVRYRVVPGVGQAVGQIADLGQFRFLGRLFQADFKIVAQRDGLVGAVLGGETLAARRLEPGLGGGDLGLGEGRQRARRFGVGLEDAEVDAVHVGRIDLALVGLGRTQRRVHGGDRVIDRRAQVLGFGQGALHAFGQEFDAGLLDRDGGVVGGTAVGGGRRYHEIVVGVDAGQDQFAVEAADAGHGLAGEAAVGVDRGDHVVAHGVQGDAAAGWRNRRRRAAGHRHREAGTVGGNRRRHLRAVDGHRNGVAGLGGAGEGDVGDLLGEIQQRRHRVQHFGDGIGHLLAFGLKVGPAGQDIGQGGHRRASLGIDILNLGIQVRGVVVREQATAGELAQHLLEGRFDLGHRRLGRTQDVVAEIVGIAGRRRDRLDRRAGRFLGRQDGRLISVANQRRRVARRLGQVRLGGGAGQGLGDGRRVLAGLGIRRRGLGQGGSRRAVLGGGYLGWAAQGRRYLGHQGVYIAGRVGIGGAHFGQGGAGRLLGGGRRAAGDARRPLRRQRVAQGRVGDGLGGGGVLRRLAGGGDIGGDVGKLGGGGLGAGAAVIGRNGGFEAGSGVIRCQHDAAVAAALGSGQ